MPGFQPWPEEVAQRYRDLGYWRDESLGDLLRTCARKYGERTALSSGTRQLSYGELDTQADRIAAGLQALGIAREDRVVVHLPNEPEFLVLCFALFRLGALPVFALPAHRRNEITYLCEFSEAVAYVVPASHGGFDYRQLAREVRSAVPSVRHVVVVGPADEFVAWTGLDREPRPLPSPAPSDVALFLLSGGTTGLPKLIPRTHEDYGYNLRASADVCGLDEKAVYLTALPVAHNFPLGCPGVLGTLYAGGTVVLTSDASPEHAFSLIEQHRVTITAVVPPLVLLWIQATEWTDADLSSLRLLQVGGAKLNPEVAKRVRSALGCSLQQVFGMAEGLLNYTRLDDEEAIVTSTQGRPLSPADELRIVDENDLEVPPGEVGQLLTRGPYTLRGYYRAPEYNEVAFTPDGFYRTGDLVRRTPSGHLVVEGRAKDLINRGGDKISAEEIENHLLAHPGVSNAAVVPMPDEYLGERTCAYVIRRTEDVTLAALTSFLRERGLAAYKLPDRLEVVDAFPLTGVGKLDKKALAARLVDTLRAERAARQK